MSANGFDAASRLFDYLGKDQFATYCPISIHDLFVTKKDDEIIFESVRLSGVLLTCFQFVQELSDDDIVNILQKNKRGYIGDFLTALVSHQDALRDFYNFDGLFVSPDAREKRHFNHQSEEAKALNLWTTKTLEAMQAIIKNNHHELPLNVLDDDTLNKFHDIINDVPFFNFDYSKLGSNKTIEAFF